jgi:hypothetical protein
MENIPTNIINNIEFAKHLYIDDVFPDHAALFNNRTKSDNEVNEYYLNSINLRDKREWVNGKPAEILALGCSQTYGLGVPQNYNWPSIVESKTGKTVANLGICGASAELNLNTFLLYLDRVGKPKYVLACFADYLRYSHIVDGKFYYVVDSKDPDNETVRKRISYLRTSDYTTGEINVKDKIFKLPGDPRYLIPAQESLHQYISSIYIIEKICKFLDIKFYWGTYAGQTQEIFTKKLFLEKNFCLDKNNHIESIKSGVTVNKFTKWTSSEQNCQGVTHSMDEEDFIKHKDGMWLIASDGAHLGIHWQHHTAESFIEKIEENK